MAEAEMTMGEKLDHTLRAYGELERKYFERGRRLTERIEQVEKLEAALSRVVETWGDRASRCAHPDMDLQVRSATRTLEASLSERARVPMSELHRDLCEILWSAGELKLIERVPPSMNREGDYTWLSEVHTTDECPFNDQERIRWPSLSPTDGGEDA